MGARRWRAWRVRWDRHAGDGQQRRQVPAPLDDVAAATTADANGNYLFDNLGADKYEVQFGSLANYMFTGYHAGADTTVDWMPTRRAFSQVVTLRAGAYDTSINWPRPELATT